MYRYDIGMLSLFSVIYGRDTHAVFKNVVKASYALKSAFISDVGDRELGAG